MNGKEVFNLNVRLQIIYKQKIAALSTSLSLNQAKVIEQALDYFLQNHPDLVEAAEIMNRAQEMIAYVMRGKTEC